MEVRLVTATGTYANQTPRPAPHFAASYLINDSLAVDAGAIGWIADLDVQRRITDVVLSHPHLDHTASLPMFLDNVFGAHPNGVRIWASESTERALRKHCFNGVIWPDLIALDSDEGRHLEMHRFRDGETIQVDQLTITPIALDHVGPTHGFLIDDGRTACAVVSDTHEVDGVWPILDAAPRLDAVFLECSFPNRMKWLADVSKHLTPGGFARQSALLSRPVRWIAIHLKAAFAEETAAELDALQMEHLEIADGDRVYEL